MPNTLLSLVSLGNTWQLGVLLYFFFELQSATQEVFLILVYIILQCETRKKKKKRYFGINNGEPQHVGISGKRSTICMIRWF